MSEEQKFRPMPIYVECAASVTIVGDKWTILLKFPKMLYDAIMVEEAEGKKTSTFPVEVILEPFVCKKIRAELEDCIDANWEDHSWCDRCPCHDTCEQIVEEE